MSTISASAPQEPPRGIKYFKCNNQGSGILIYPQLRDVSDPQTKIIWDGRKVSGFKYMITPNSYLKVNLVEAGVDQNAVFYLSENTMLGTDFWCTAHVFKVDPNTENMATSTRVGAADSGGFECQEKMLNDQTVENTHAILQPSAKPLKLLVPESLTHRI